MTPILNDLTGVTKDQAPVWVVTDDRIGIQVQALGLAEALGLPFLAKRVNPAFPWSWAPISWARPQSLLNANGLDQPWPSLVIGCGRRLVPFLTAMRTPKTKIVFVGDPTIDPKAFDLVVAPAHDDLRGANVLITLGSMHRVTAAHLAEAPQDFAQGLPHPRIGVLLGGKSNHHDMPLETARDLGRKLRKLAEEGAGLMVTPSRRTPASALAELRRLLDHPGIRVWDGQGENPYFGILAAADLVIVTNDSVNMASEASAAGKPVLVFDLPGRSRRIENFHRDMVRLGHTRPFTGELDLFPAFPLEEMAPIAARIRQLLAETA